MSFGRREVGRAKRAAVLCALLLVPGAVFAQEAPPPGAFRREVNAYLAFGANPTALEGGIEVAWRRSLSQSKNPFLADAHLTFGIVDRLSPEYNRLGAFVEISPLSVLDLRLGIEPTFYFGAYSSLLPFAAYDAPFDDETRKQLQKEGRNVAGFGGRAYFAPTAKIKVGRLVARARAEWEWWRVENPGQPFYYEPLRDTLLEAAGDSMLTTEALLAYEARTGRGRSILVGAVHTLNRVRAAPANDSQDVGLLVVWGLGTRRFFMVEPSVIAKAFYYLEDPNRDGVGALVAVAFRLGR